MRELGVDWNEAQLVLTVAPLLGVDDPEVAAAVRRALAILDRLGAVPLAARLRAVASDVDRRMDASVRDEPSTEATTRPPLEPAVGELRR
jgi:hypothetical protein